MLLNTNVATYNTRALVYFGGRAALTGPEYSVSFAVKMSWYAGSDILATILRFKDSAGNLQRGLVGNCYSLTSKTTWDLIWMPDPGSGMPVVSGLNYDQVYIITMYWKDQSGAVADKVWVDGVLKLNRTDDPYVGTSIVSLEFGMSAGKNVTGTSKIRIDDVWVEDGATGLVYPLPNIVVDKPISQGTYNEWPGDWSNWDDVPNDGDTTYNETGAGAGLKRQTSGLTAVANIPLVATDVIQGVAAKAVAKVTAGTTGQCSVLVRDNGADYTTDFTVTTSYQATYDRVDAVMPNGGAAWTQARLAAFQAGMQRATGDRNLRATGMYAMVGYVPQAPVAGRRRVSVC
jgi:hypothetical protein